uniref:Magnetosome protein Mad30 n=1 Tax=Candidatus Magnetananas rongchengensis TaxID=1463558 RepID=A0A3Q8B159_9BACT|nr:magnetosome protein Mad30 [Candidatus Magnetananas rongchenensis]
MNKQEKDEYLERLWVMEESGQDTVEELKRTMGSYFDNEKLEGIANEKLVTLSESGTKVVLTKNGRKLSRQIIRAHRIGERLLYDVYGKDFEQGACEFEHTTTIELVDGICTLLGHPKECPHGLPIPEGECCRNYAETAHNVVKHLNELEVGQSARVAYINCRSDGQMHRLNGFQIKPGATITLHQRTPCHVVECEGASIALDEEIVSNICVWSTSPEFKPEQRQSLQAKELGNKAWWKRLFNFN